MGCVDYFENKIDKFEEAPKLLKASFFLILITLICHIIGFATNYWLDGDGNQGLWNYCEVNSVYLCCSTIQFQTDQLNSDVPVFINATRSFQSLGLIGGIVASVSIVIGIFSDDDGKRKKAQIFTVIVSFFTAFVILLGIIIYSGSYRNESFTSKLIRSYSYAMCTIAGILFIFPGVLIIRVSSKNNSISPDDDRGVRSPQQVSTSIEENLCIICNDEQKEMLFNPCHHRVCCRTCSNRLMDLNRPREFYDPPPRTCPVCRSEIREVVRVY